MQTFLFVAVCAAALAACNQDSAASNSERSTHMGSIHAVETPHPAAASPGTPTATATATTTGSTTR